jgi:hypothetical protein
MLSIILMADGILQIMIGAQAFHAGLVYLPEWIVPEGLTHSKF